MPRAPIVSSAVFGIASVCFAHASGAQESAAPAPSSVQRPWLEPHDLGALKNTKVLYAGVLGTERAKSFVAFLQSNFATVGAIEVTDLSAARAAKFDVVVCDGKRVYPMDPKRPGLDLPHVQLGSDFTKPIVMIGAMAGTVQHHTKIDWL